MTDKAVTTKPQLDVLTADQAARVDRIKVYHAAAHKAFGDHIGYVFLTGAEMVALKEEVEGQRLLVEKTDGSKQRYGVFEKIRALHFPEIPERSARRYMEFAGALSRTATVAALPTVGNGKLLTNGELPEKDREKILKAAHKQADGKTITQLYRDLGVIRDKEAPAHHPQKELTPEEKIAAENEQAAARRAALITELNLMADDLESKTSFLAARTSPAQAKEIQAALRRLGKLINPLTKRKSKEGKSTKK